LRGQREVVGEESNGFLAKVVGWWSLELAIVEPQGFAPDKRELINPNDLWRFAAF